MNMFNHLNNSKTLIVKEKQYKYYIKDFEERRNNWLEEHNRNK